MKIYITGGTGFVGSHLSGALAKDHDVTVGGLNPESSVVEIPEGVERERIDVTERSSLDFSGFDCVIHLVALSPLMKPPVPYRRIHVEGTSNVVSQAVEDNVDSFFYMSALGTDLNADTEYLRTKAEAEEVVKDSDLEWRIMHPSTIFGEGGQFLDFISNLTTPYITVLPGKNTRFQPIHVEDIVKCIEQSLKDEYSQEIFEIGGPDKIRLGKIAKMIERSKGRGLKVIGLPMAFFRLAMIVSERVPSSPFGTDQYFSLRKDNVTEHNDVKNLGIKTGEMTRLEEYLD